MVRRIPLALDRTSPAKATGKRATTPAIQGNCLRVKVICDQQPTMWMRRLDELSLGCDNQALTGHSVFEPGALFVPRGHAPGATLSRVGTTQFKFISQPAHDIR